MYRSASANKSVCTIGFSMGRKDWFGRANVWCTLAPKKQSDVDLVGPVRAVQLLLGHTKVEKTVRYLGVEVEDAYEIAESIDV